MEQFPSEAACSFCLLTSHKSTSLPLSHHFQKKRKKHLTCFCHGYLLGFRFLRSNFPQWEVKNPEQKWSFTYISNSIKFILQKRSDSWEKFRIMLTCMQVEILISSLQSTLKVQGLASLRMGRRMRILYSGYADTN